MKRLTAVLIGVSLLVIMMSACAQNPSAEQETGSRTKITTIDSSEAEKEASAENVESLKEETGTEPEETESHEAQLPEQQKKEEPMNQARFYITANNVTFAANFADNDSADALRELLSEGDLTINMSDYGSFEKVGSIGESLPRKDTQMSTTVGDIMLYQGDKIVIFYGTNSWSYSRLGRIEDADADDLLSAFGNGDVDITFSLTNPE